jgi:hypothetical protein
MKEKLLKELHKMIIAIVKANDADLEKIGARLVEIEKELVTYQPNKKNKIDFSQKI